jgi:hypothetical protein
MTPLLSTPLLRAQSDRRLTALAGDGRSRVRADRRALPPAAALPAAPAPEALAEDVLWRFLRAWVALRAALGPRPRRGVP